jgi:hypothetical protein
MSVLPVVFAVSRQTTAGKYPISQVTPGIPYANTNSALFCELPTHDARKPQLHKIDFNLSRFE